MLWKLNFILWFSLIITLLYSCDQSPKTTPIKTPEPTKAEVHYTYYLPSDSLNIKSILIIMDPHGEPNLIMDSLQLVSNQNNIALLGLPEISNGISNHQFIIQRDLKDFIQSKNLQNIKLYLLGFSGAARMATVYAQNNRIDGLLLCGAGLGRQTELPFPTVLMAGMGDFNFMEQYYSPSDPRTFQKKTIALHFYGKHQWPPAEIITDAIGFIENRAKNTGNEMAKEFEIKSESYFQKGAYYLSFKYSEAAYKLSNEAEDEQRRNKLVALSNNKRVKNYFQQLNTMMEEEQKRYSILSESLTSKDSIWWKNQINFIENKSTNSTNTIESQSYTRTLAYMGILMYSRLNATIAGRGQYALIPTYLSIYERIEPDNPDLYFFKAVYAYTQSNDADALLFLQKAKDLGFNNLPLMNKFFSQDFINTLQ